MTCSHPRDHATSSGFRSHAAARTGCLNSNIDRVKLMVPSDLLSYRAAAEILKDNEVSNEIEKAPFIENALDYHLQFRKVGSARRLARNRPHGLDHSQPAPSDPISRLDSVQTHQCSSYAEQ